MTRMSSGGPETSIIALSVQIMGTSSIMEGPLLLGEDLYEDEEGVFIWRVGIASRTREIPFNCMKAIFFAVSKLSSLDVP